MAGFREAFQAFLDTEPNDDLSGQGFSFTGPSGADRVSEPAKHHVEREPNGNLSHEFRFSESASGGPFIDPLADSLDSASREIIADVPGAEQELDDLIAKASTKPNWVLARLSGFGEVLGNVARKFRRLPEKLEGIIQRFREVAAAVAKAFKAVSFSITINMPWSVAIGFSWNP